MKRKHSKFTPSEKAKMVLEGLKYPDGISAYCRTKGIRDGLFYKWKEQILERADDVFGIKKTNDKVEIDYQNKINRKDEIISELVSENIDLKKKYGM